MSTASASTSPRSWPATKPAARSKIRRSSWDIETDPVLAGTKLIAEAWDAAGLYQVGSFIGDSWKEWNGRFRDDVRAFCQRATEARCGCWRNACSAARTSSDTGNGNPSKASTS